MDKEIDALVTLDAVHDRREDSFPRFNLDPDLFFRFTRGCCDHSFPSIQMPSRDAVFAIAKARVITARQQYLILSEEKEMDSDRKFCAHYPLYFAAEDGGWSKEFIENTSPKLFASLGPK
jgi:hypothetical protein